MTFYPLYQILVYLALLFAPADTARITITGPDGQAVEIRRVAEGWSTTTPDGKSALASIADGVLTLQTGDAPDRLPLAEYVSAAIGHDWAATPKLTLHGTTTLEKTATGFVLRVNDGDTAVRAYAIVYEPSPAQATVTDTITVNVIGSVNAPAAYSLPADAKLLDAIAAAGGFTRLSDRSRVKILRGPAGQKPTSLLFNSEKLADKNARGPALQDGDTIAAPERIF